MKEITVVRTKNGEYAGVYMKGECLCQGYVDGSEDCMEPYISGASAVADSVIEVTTKNTTELPYTWPE